MKKQSKQVEEFVLEVQDIKVIKEVLNYAWHRAVNHKTPMSQLREEIKRLRGEFGIVLKENKMYIKSWNAEDCFKFLKRY